MTLSDLVFFRRPWGFLLALAMALATSCVPARALDYPTRTVKIVIPFQAGTAPDVLLRVVAQGLSEKWAQPVVVENRPGGNTMIGTAAVAKSNPDGYTLLFTADQTFVLTPLLYSSLPYQEDDLAPIVLVASSPHILAVSKELPVHSVQELVALAKQKPDMILYGSSGTSSMQHIAVQYFARLTGIQLRHVPYKGAYETVTALLRNEIGMTINGMAVIMPYLPNGEVRALAISTPQRSPLAPDLPTMQEAGVNGYSSQGTFGLLAPAGMATEIGEKIRADVVEVLKKPETRKVLAARSFEVSGLGPSEFKSFIADEKAKWRQVIESAGIKGE